MSLTDKQEIFSPPCAAYGRHAVPGLPSAGIPIPKVVCGTFRSTYLFPYEGNGNSPDR